MNDLAAIHYAQRQRLAFIDFCLQFVGRLARADLVNQFRIGLASCPRDINLYRELAPDNMQLEHETKQYYRTNRFEPIFNHKPEVILHILRQGFGDGLSNNISQSEQRIEASRLIHPKSEIIATLTRAMKNQHAVLCNYVSLSSGESIRTIVPHAIANNGQRWHIRAYDRNSEEFRDFVCTRLQSVSEIQSPVSSVEGPEYDVSWNKIVDVKLIVHPSVTHPNAIELDFGMVDGVLSLELREALLGYLMRQWNVDCSPTGSLTGKEFHLKLENIDDFKGLDSLAVAPGYI